MHVTEAEFGPFPVFQMIFFPEVAALLVGVFPLL